MNGLYLYEGSLYNITGCEIERPTVLIDPETDTFHGWGNYNTIAKKCEQINQAGFEFSMIELTQLPKPITAYIILRMMNYTASGFITKFYNHKDDPQAMSWLTSEISRVPIEIPDKPE